MNQVLDFSVPHWFELDELEFLSARAVPNNENQMLVLVGENLDGQKECLPTVRVYLAEKLDGLYECTREIDAILFKTVAEIERFVEELHDMDAIQFLANSIHFKRNLHNI